MPEAPRSAVALQADLFLRHFLRHANRQPFSAAKYHYNLVPVSGRVVTIIDTTDVAGGTGIGLVAMIEVVVLTVAVIHQGGYQQPA